MLPLNGLEHTHEDKDKQQQHASQRKVIEGDDDQSWVAHARPNLDILDEEERKDRW